MYCNDLVRAPADCSLLQPMRLTREGSSLSFTPLRLPLSPQALNNVNPEHRHVYAMCMTQTIFPEEKWHCYLFIWMTVRPLWTECKKLQIAKLQSFLRILPRGCVQKKVAIAIATVFGNVSQTTCSWQVGPYRIWRWSQIFHMQAIDLILTNVSEVNDNFHPCGWWWSQPYSQKTKKTQKG